MKIKAIINIRVISVLSRKPVIVINSEQTRIPEETISFLVNHLAYVVVWDNTSRSLAQ